MDGGGLEWSRPWIREKERWLLTFSILMDQPDHSLTPDNLVVDMGDIQTIVHPKTATGRNLKKEHMAQVSNALEEWLQRKNRETTHSLFV